MAFNFQVIRGSTTYTFYGAGQPIRLEDADDLGGADVRNIEERGPNQDGATHLDHRLEPGVFTLRFIVVGASASALDGHRDTLNEAFKPIRGVPITLKITRDDGEVRQIDCQRTGRLAIPLRKLEKPGNLHRAVVQLRAADPKWYDDTGGETTFGHIGDWWLAFDTIGTANVLAHATYPSAGTPWGQTAGVGSGDPWSIFTRTSRMNAGTAGQHYLYDARSSSPFNSVFMQGQGVNPPRMQVNARNFNGTISTGFVAATADYYFQAGSGTRFVYRNNELLATNTEGEDRGLPGTAGTALWRSDAFVTFNWPDEVPFAAVYSTNLTEVQRRSLTAACNIGTATTGHAAAIVYAGDVDEYPLIYLYGYMSDPVITNATTGDVLDFTGGTIATADVWTIDLRYGRKSVTNFAGSSQLPYLSDASDLSTFALVAAPVAPLGVNVITVQSATSGTAGSVVMSYDNRYISY